MTKKTFVSFLALLLVCTLYSCSNLNFNLPPGLKGDDGDSTYEIWKKEVQAGNVNWPRNKVAVEDFLVYIKGEKGDRGETGKSAYELWKELISKGNVPNPHNPSEMWPIERNKETDFWDFITGRDGQSPHIGNNDNWWIGNVDTGVRARGKDGKDGKDGLSAYEIWKTEVLEGRIAWDKDRVEVEHFFQFLKGKDGKDGKDGVTPHIGENGNWWIGDFDTKVPARGEDGRDGYEGKSAYELWKADLKEGKIKDPTTGAPWPKDEDTQEDFWRFLKGAKGDKGNDGVDGKSAYEIWVDMVTAQQLDDPKNPGTKWPATDTTKVDFYKFLMGKDGANGTNGTNGKDGKTAYELWKEDLEASFNTDQPLKDHRTGEKWPKDKNKLEDFWEFLRGKDGKDGADGKPGEPGKPGAKVEIIHGVPNVIAQYSQAEYGEYVQTTTGGVTYLVYDEAGNLAPGATVKGLPGLPNQETVYTANEKGEVFVPKADLPWIHDLQSRWGSTKEVVIPGKPAKASASNTYVPNKINLRLIVVGPNDATKDEDKPYLTGNHVLTFRIQRQIGPNDPWTDLPSYLPAVTEIDFGAYPTTSEDPTTIQTTPELVSAKRATDHFKIEPKRYVMENKYQFMNGYNAYWNKQTNYFTVKQKTKYYDELVQWNGVCEMAPYQASPMIKCLTLRTKQETLNQDAIFFVRATGQFDYADINYDKIYNKELAERKQGEVVILAPVLMTQEAAKQLLPTYIKFARQTAGGTQLAESNLKPSGPVGNTGYEVNTVYLDSEVTVRSLLVHVFPDNMVYGRVKAKAGDANSYQIERSKNTLRDPQVAYQDK
ncbi:hypothetical protein [Porphyromonas sp.]|uniref:hypothetical protein n=1 Tax=Porphyromonas sp. TaxID=1924944 RepID=UPI0026DCB6E5|nr:hypothetical protein [Porphyromonas sp.]MDO4770776.1 hypothetical protein [Porphyromonas sp.]